MGPNTQTRASPARIQRPATASRFFPGRSQASRESERVASAEPGPAGADGMGGAWAGMSVEFQPRVEPDLDDVDQEVEHDDEHGIEENRAQDQRVIPVEGRGDEK